MKNEWLSFQCDRVAEDVFIAPNATILGRVDISHSASVWFGAVIRGDTEQISIGPETNVQDLCVVHADPGFPCRLGARVTVGHAAVVHGATVEDDVMIGMKAVVLNGATIGSGSVIAAGCVVREGMKVPPNSFVAGVPGQIKKSTTDDARSRIAHAAKHYVDLSTEYRRLAEA